MLAEDLDAGIHELLVLQHLQPRLRAGVPALRSQHELPTLGARLESVRPDAADKVGVPLLGFSYPAKDGIDLDSGNRLGGDILKPECDARHELVLAVDDSKIVRVKTSRVLAPQGYQVVLAESAEEAIEKFAAQAPHVLITDVEMPGMDGFELTRHVRATPALAHVPVIMITSSDDRQEAAQAAGVSTLLGKPYSEEALIACIETARQAVQVPA